MLATRRARALIRCGRRPPRRLLDAVEEHVRLRAFVALKQGYAFTFEDMTAYLSELQVTKQYFPERLEVLEQMPQTPSGKLQKFKLREMARAFADNA